MHVLLKRMFGLKSIWCISFMQLTRLYWLISEEVWEEIIACCSEVVGLSRLVCPFHTPRVNLNTCHVICKVYPRIHIITLSCVTESCKFLLLYRCLSHFLHVVIIFITTGTFSTTKLFFINEWSNISFFGKNSKCEFQWDSRMSGDQSVESSVL